VTGASGGPLNRGFAYVERVARRDAGRPLLAHLTDRYRHTDGPTWEERIRAGLVLLDGSPAAPDAVLRPGQILTWMRPPWREPEAPLQWALLYEDDDLVVVAKPSGLPTLPGAGYLEHTLLALVRRRYPEAAPLHRLGRGTSGLVLFSRTVRAARALSKAWRDRTVTKVYRALVTGSPEKDEFVVETAIGPTAHPALGTVHAAHPAGKPSVSRVRVLERRGEETLVEVTIETGRPHQIRVHMASCGHPLVGDPLYAPGGGFRGGALPGDMGYHLHALRLALPHPRTGALLEVTCPPPPLLRTRRDLVGSGGGN
jgi:23S rRNA pseudouridine1911/1915/1917 synthase